MPHRSYAPRGRAGDPDEPGPVRRELIYGMAVLVLVAFGAFVWKIYAGRDPPRIGPSVAAYKVAPPPMADGPDSGEQTALDDVLSGRPAAAGPVQARPGPEAPLTASLAAPAPVTAPGARPELSPAPVFVPDGPYVAQIAALQSEEAVQAAWTRLSSRAPGLFAAARLDVERADLGQRGVYYRVRAGYFADRENVARFCDRVKAMGQDCIAVLR
ncbi:MAG: SPOR domain-containing protein [Hyphomonadaceae bacterium]